VPKKLVSCGADYFGVASIDEGIRLRQARINKPILVLGMILKNDIKAIFDYNLTPSVCTQGLTEAINKKAKSLKRPVNVHIKIDTGMGRLGVLHYDAARLVKGVHRLKYIKIEGIFTHFAFADLDKDFTLYQIDLFNRLIRKLEKDGIHIPLRHAANSQIQLGL